MEKAKKNAIGIKKISNILENISENKDVIKKRVRYVSPGLM